MTTYDPDTNESPERYSSLIEALERLSRWHSKKLNDHQTEEYVKALQWIPGVAISEIADLHIEETSPFPARFPTINQIKNRWLEWKSAHPDKISRAREHKQINCPHCWNNLGLIVCRVTRDGRRYEEVCRCGHCDNWRAIYPVTTEAPIATTDQLMLRGYEIVQQPKSPFSRQGGVKGMAAGVGTHTNPGKRQEHFKKTKRQGPPPLPGLGG